MHQSQTYSSHLEGSKVCPSFIILTKIHTTGLTLQAPLKSFKMIGDRFRLDPSLTQLRIDDCRRRRWRWGKACKRRCDRLAEPCAKVVWCGALAARVGVVIVRPTGGAYSCSNGRCGCSIRDSLSGMLRGLSSLMRMILSALYVQ